MAVPHHLAVGDATMREREALRSQTNTAVEQQDELGLRLCDSSTSCLEPSRVGLDDDRERQSVIKRASRDVRAPIRRAVIDEDDLGVEGALVDRAHESVQSCLEVGAPRRAPERRR